MRNFNEIFKQDLRCDFYDNIKSNKEAGLHPLTEKSIIGKTIGEVKLTPPSYFRVKPMVEQNSIPAVVFNI